MEGPRNSKSHGATHVTENNGLFDDRETKQKIGTDPNSQLVASRHEYLHSYIQERSQPVFSGKP